MITKCLTLTAALLGGAVLAVPPALAESRAPSLKPALLVSEDVGDDFVPNGTKNRSPLLARHAHTKPCAKAVNGLIPFYRSKTATWLMRDGVTEGVNEFIVNGSAAQIDGLERAAKVLVRDCGHVKARGASVRETINRLSVGKLGSATYGIKFRAQEPDAEIGPIMAVDLVVIRDGNTIALVEHNGFYARFEPELTGDVATTAATKLHEALNG
ncbi:hypothetical protein [Nonomuraea sediminis]|uniref:hypothetical protein n=1 Tax=Nonomuraea sediminis TaxID=2835864 RepID=UPI001BDBC23A|nr:hypothetical protein [Nonomuraea sediminis]